MKVRVGILGLPNVGKSTLFNALAQKSLAQAANFPFCTIDPNTAPIAVPDAYLGPLGALAGSERTVPATMEWVDVAGLVKGASRGEGLGNRFLGVARECDAICHVLRAFDDDATIHVDGRVDPASDAAVVGLELILADLGHVERRLEKPACTAEERESLEQVHGVLGRGLPARAAGLTPSAAFAIKAMGLLTLKPVLFAINVDEVDFTLGRAEALARARALFESIDHEPTDALALVSAKLEAELGLRPPTAQLEYLASLGVEPEAGTEGETGTEGLGALLCHRELPTLVRRMLALDLVYTGPGVAAERSQTTRAHLFPRGTLTAEGLAARIHGKIERGFVAAEVVPAAALLQHDSLAAARDAGCVRAEGRGHMLGADDVVLVKWRE